MPIMVMTPPEPSGVTASWTISARRAVARRFDISATRCCAPSRKPADVMRDGEAATHCPARARWSVELPRNKELEGAQFRSVEHGDERLKIVLPDEVVIPLCLTHAKVVERSRVLTIVVRGERRAAA